MYSAAQNAPAEDKWPCEKMGQEQEEIIRPRGYADGKEGHRKTLNIIRLEENTD